MRSTVYLLVLAITLFFSSTFGSAQSTGGIDTSCFFDTDCKVPNSYCEDRSSCTCLPTFTYNAHKGKCEQVGCRTHSDCEEYANMECKNSICVCRTGYIASTNDNHTCLSVVHYNEQCEDDLQCQDSDTYCSQGVCQCKEGFRRKGNSCLITSDTNDCFSDSDCHSKYPNTHCKSRTCICDRGFVESNRDRYSCLPEAHLNDTCQESVQCKEKNIFCKEGRCQYKPDKSAAYMLTSNVWLMAVISSILTLKK